MSLRLLNDDVAIIPVKDELRTESGIWLADQTRQLVDQGIVKYRGPATIDVRVGDHVVFEGYSGTKVSIEDEGVLIVLPESGVHAIYEGNGQGVMFPKILVDQLLDEAIGDVFSRTGDEPERVNYIFQIIKTKFDDYVREKGLEF